jgi:FkbM family methyltransferase
MIGSSIARLGVHELAVTETIYRLVGPGDRTIDLGANIGYDTSLLAHRAGVKGVVHAFEPHPVLYDLLCRNVGHLPGVRVYRRGVSDHRGDSFLQQSDDFSANMGSSSLADSGIPIALTTLDAAIPDEDISLMKIDIEGQELAALAGGSRTLARTRHVIFEEHGPLPTPVTARLQSAGFDLYGIAEAWRGARLVAAEALGHGDQWEAPNYLATRDPRVQQLVRDDGWRCLRPRRGSALAASAVVDREDSDRVGDGELDGDPSGVA